MARRDYKSFSPYLDCDSCMKSRSKEDRQLDACGLEPPAADGVAVDHPERIRHAWEKDIPEVCPGYTCSLPEVLETSYALSFKRDGELTQFLEGEYASPELRHAMTVLESEIARMQEWSARTPDKDGAP